MARDPNSAELTADYEALLAQLTAMRAEMTKLASQIATSATERGAAMSDTVTQGMHDARAYAGRKSHEADRQIEQAVAANPYVALGLAAGLGLLLGALTRR